MAIETAYDRGYEVGQQLYAEYPDLSHLALMAWVDTKIVCESIPVQKHGDYQSGILDGYDAGYEAAKKSEAKS